MIGVTATKRDEISEQRRSSKQLDHAGTRKLWYFRNNRHVAAARDTWDSAGEGDTGTYPTQRLYIYGYIRI